jgi:hypothetical protein
MQSLHGSQEGEGGMSDEMVRDKHKGLWTRAEEAAEAADKAEQMRLQSSREGCSAGRLWPWYRPRAA